VACIGPHRPCIGHRTGYSLHENARTSGLASADFEAVFAHSYKRWRPRLFLRALRKDERKPLVHCCGRNGRHEQRKLTSLFPLRTGGIRLQLPLHRMWRRTSFLPSELLSSGLPRAYVFGDSPSPDVTSGASGRSGKAGAMIARRRKHTASTNHHPQS